MRISDKKAAATYEAISKPITDLRVENNGGLSIEEMDKRLFDLEQKIWINVVDSLNLKTIK